MRKYHRWLSVLFGIFLLWIAATGVMIQFAELRADSEKAQHEPPSAEAVAGAIRGAPAGFVCPPALTCRPTPKPNVAHDWSEWLMHLHSGESFGVAGTAISILSGLALLFFSFSGLWMYTRMWLNRTERGTKPKWFWK